VSVTGTTKPHTLRTPTLAWKDVPEEVIATILDTTTETTIAMLTKQKADNAIQMIMIISTLEMEREYERVLLI
jgi:hypothetical protein